MLITILGIAPPAILQAATQVLGFSAHAMAVLDEGPTAPAPVVPFIGAFAAVEAAAGNWTLAGRETYGAPFTGDYYAPCVAHNTGGDSRCGPARGVG
jgi:hypothetical protein